MRVTLLAKEGNNFMAMLKEFKELKRTGIVQFCQMIGAIEKGVQLQFPCEKP